MPGTAPTAGIAATHCVRVFSVLLLRMARVTPFVALAMLLGAWALCAWGRDQSLSAYWRRTFPPVAYCVLAIIALVASAIASSWPRVLAALLGMVLAIVPLGG